MSEYPIGSTAKVYHDSGGTARTLYQMVRLEPDWAKSRIIEGEKAAARVKELEEEPTCSDCDDKGWLEDRAGRYPCTCISETDEYQRMAQRVKELEEVLGEIANSSQSEDGCYYTNNGNIRRAKQALKGKEG